MLTTLFGDKVPTLLEAFKEVVAKENKTMKDSRIDQKVYGYYTIVNWHTTTDGSWMRKDEYHPTYKKQVQVGNTLITAEGVHTFTNVLVTGPTDRSYVQYGGYNPKCSCCFLGVTHSEDVHNQSIV